jgi:hypothetical protein
MCALPYVYEPYIFFSDAITARKIGLQRNGKIHESL